MKFIKKFMAPFLCVSLTINSVSVCYSLEKCDSNKIWNERYKIENLIKQDLRDGTNFVEKTDNLSGNNEYKVYAYLTEDALSKINEFNADLLIDKIFNTRFNRGKVFRKS